MNSCNTAWTVDVHGTSHCTRALLLTSKKISHFFLSLIFSFLSFSVFLRPTTVKFRHGSQSLKSVLGVLYVSYHTHVLSLCRGTHRRPEFIFSFSSLLFSFFLEKWECSNIWILIYCCLFYTHVYIFILYM